MSPNGGRWAKCSKKQGSLAPSAVPKVIVIKAIFGNNFVYCYKCNLRVQAGQGPLSFPKELPYVLVGCGTCAVLINLPMTSWVEVRDFPSI